MQESSHISINIIQISGTLKGYMMWTLALDEGGVDMELHWQIQVDLILKIEEKCG